MPPMNSLTLLTARLKMVIFVSIFVGCPHVPIQIAYLTEKLDFGMRGPYRVEKVLRHDRYELRLLTGCYGKLTRAAAENIAPWRGESPPDAKNAALLRE
ncbi:hypothetical protein EVAR_53435_1 [Eumeta japonica]|uniref:Uncharacterized protein n=1 Tax=Eumeta variegata TaxID=151549 RepID=A0A4C1Y0G2_EUMVA|nr:hypothetical protein EVAR_53435_1 [Eumeta japonica]